MQAEGWVNVQAIGRGANGSVYHGTSALYPSGVLKRGDQENLWADADLMHKINHPNMGQVYCKMTSSEISPNGRQIDYLVMKPLGRSLRALLAQRGRRGKPSSCVAVNSICAVLTDFGIPCLLLLQTCLCVFVAPCDSGCCAVCLSGTALCHHQSCLLMHNGSGPMPTRAQAQDQLEAPAWPEPLPTHHHQLGRN